MVDIHMLIIYAAPALRYGAYWIDHSDNIVWSKVYDEGLINLVIPPTTVPSHFVQNCSSSKDLCGMPHLITVQHLERVANATGDSSSSPAATNSQAIIVLCLCRRPQMVLFMKCSCNINIDSMCNHFLGKDTKVSST